MQVRIGGVALLGTLFSSACTISDLDLAGRPCPCLDGWVCDPGTQTCRTLASDEGAVDVVSFKADWSTPNAIRWSWEVSGSEADFHAYELVLGESHEEVAQRTRVFTGDENPELDRFTLPRTDGEDPVISTITRGLVPDTEYFAQLLVFDTANKMSSSANVAQKRTALAPIDSIEIMADQAPPTLGWVQPMCLTLDDQAFAGSQAYGYAHRCDRVWNDVVQEYMVQATCNAPQEPQPECWENLFLEGMAMPIDASRFTAGAYEAAYLEFVLRIDDSHHAWWASTGLRPVGFGTALPGFFGITFRASGEYELYQFKLSTLLSHEQILAGLETFFVGGAWEDGATIHFDEVFIRW
jgi:hypothetical protein